MTDAVPYDLHMACARLSPARGGRIVASDANFAIGPGGALVVRGANGSGKSSLLRAIAGLCPHEGAIGFERGDTRLDPDTARAGLIHLLAGGEGLAPKLTAREHVVFWSGLYGVPVGEGLGAVGLVLAADQAAGALSTGQRRRLGLARLLMAPRPLWLLDEPLSGLDAEGRALLLGAVANHRAAGGLVVMATHEEEGLPGAGVLRLA